MEHGKKNRKFGRETKQRAALMRDLANALVIHGKVQTTEAKAKSLRVFIEKLVSKGKKSDLATIRTISSVLNPRSANKIIKEISSKYSDRHGGYTRIIKLGVRSSDSAKMAIIEFIK